MTTSHSSRALTCPNGHAMDEGYFECPCCGAYRPSANDPAALIKNGRVVGIRPESRYERQQREWSENYIRTTYCGGL